MTRMEGPRHQQQSARYISLGGFVNSLSWTVVTTAQIGMGLELAPSREHLVQMTALARSAAQLAAFFVLPALGSLSAKVKGAEVCTFAGSSFVVYHTACCGRSACGEEHRWTVHKRFSEWKTLRRATKADSEGVCFPKQMEGRIRGLASGRPDMAIAGKRASRLDDFVQHLLRAPLSLSDGSVQAVCAFLCADRDVHAAASDRDVHAAASSSDGAARATHGSERSTAASIACNLRCVRRAEGV